MAARALGPSEGSKSAAASSLQDPALQQSKKSEHAVGNGPSLAEDAAMRPKAAEVQSNKPVQQAGPSANAANTAARSAAGPKVDIQPVNTGVQNVEAHAPAPRQAAPADGKSEGTAVSSVDGKDTPRHHEVTCMHAPSVPVTFWWIINVFLNIALLGLALFRRVVYQATFHCACRSQSQSSRPGRLWCVPNPYHALFSAEIDLFR